MNQPTPSPEREEYPLPTKEPADEEEEAPAAAEEEEEEPVEEVDNITETIPPGFASMPRYKKHRLNSPSPNMIMEDEDDSSLE